MKRKRTLAELEKELKKPIKLRSEIKPTKIFKDKTKYNRKNKHRDSVEQD